MNTTQFSSQFKDRGEDLNPNLPDQFKGGSKEKIEKVDKVRRKTTQEDIQLELDLYPLRRGETMLYSLDSSIRIAGPQ